MDATSFITFLQTVGFPIAACVAMGLYVKYITDAHREDSQRTATRNQEQITAITEAITNNTLVIQKLVDRLDKDGEICVRDSKNS